MSLSRKKNFIFHIKINFYVLDVVWSYAIEDLSILPNGSPMEAVSKPYILVKISKKFAVPDSPSPQFKKFFIIQHSPERGRTESLPFTQG